MPKGEPTGEYDRSDMSLEMPFVSVTSVGGEYDDSAFAAGWVLGYIDCEMRVRSEDGGSVPPSRWINDGHLKQLDLIAMRYGYSFTVDPEKRAPCDETHYWEWVVFSR